MFDIEEITHKTALDAFRAAFCRRVGVGRGRISYGDLQDLTGIPVRTLKSWAEGQAMPQLDKALKLCAALGPDFTCEILGLIGQGGVEQIDKPVKSSVVLTMAELSSQLARITDRLRDEVFDYAERRATGAELIKLAPMIEAQGKAMIAEGPER